MKLPIQFVFLLFIGLPLAARAEAGGDRALPTGSVSLSEASALVLERHPSLQVYEYERRAAEARVLSALERPNPELEGEIEDVAGTGEFRSFQSAVYNLGVSQLIELGGKRKRRGDVAHSQVSEADLQYEAQVRQVLAETAVRFVDVLEAQQSEADARATVEIANEALENVQRQQDEGRASPIDVAQSQIAVENARVSLKNTQLRSALARQRLAALWNEEATFESVHGTLPAPAKSLPSADRLRAACDDHPRLRLAEAEVETAEARVELEEARRVPDVTAGLSFRHDSPSDDSAIVFGFSVPLPIWNRNEGGIAEAQALRDKQRMSVELTRKELEMVVVATHAELRAAQAEYCSVTGDLFEAAKTAYESTLEGHRLGRFTYLELLEARREFVGLRARKTEALARYNRARVKLEAMTGDSLWNPGS